MNFFEIIHKDKKTQARTGVIHTDHGDIETPVFMPVGTQATVKTLDKQDLENIDASIILANTYHLHLRPGEDLIDKFGGLHKFMNWDRPILTDSGGFQVFSLGLQKEEKGQGSLTKIDDDGVTFKSHLDGSTHRFTPESAIQIQHKIGADIIMAFDECTPDDADEKYTKKAMARTHNWAQRCITEHKRLNKETKNSELRTKNYLFGIIQGADYKDLRIRSAQELVAMNFDGYAVGGLAVGESSKTMYKVLDYTVPELPENKARYLMGVGYPDNIIEAVKRGIDMFDCVIPTREARHGRLYIWKGKPDVTKKNFYTTINITNAKFAKDTKSINNTNLKSYSKAYLHHLFKTQEPLALRLATLNNLKFYLDMMRDIRRTIKNNKL